MSPAPELANELASMADSGDGFGCTQILHLPSFLVFNETRYTIPSASSL